MLKFHLRYFITFIALLVVEIFIGLFFHDRFIRPYFGDFLIVIVLYCLVKSFFKVPVIATAVSVLLFAYVVEVLQYFKLVELLGLQDSEVARILLGSWFTWGDMVMYTVGIGVVVLVEEANIDKVRLK